jgi:transposase
MVRAAPTPAVASSTALGVDDWAQCRGRTAGTLLLHRTTPRVVDLLPDRTAATLARWLRGPPEVQVSARDRAGAYAEGARLGAPQALPVADRLPFPRNVTAARQRYLGRKPAALRQASESALGDAPPTAPTAHQAPPAARLSQERRARRHAQDAAVITLHAQGQRIRTIAATTQLSTGTILKYLHAEGLPERQPRAPRPRLRAPFVDYLRALGRRRSQRQTALAGTARAGSLEGVPAWRTT